MKTIFLCDKKETIERVYSTVIDKTDGIDKSVYTYGDVVSGKEDFSSVEYAFSTWGAPKLSTEEIKKHLPNLKCLFYGAGSVQAFARPYLDAGVRIFSAWGANAVPVAEFTVAEIILANKGYYLTNRQFHKDGKRERAKATSATCPGNYGETVGIIGAGMIGKLVIKMLKAYNLKVVVFDPFLPDEKAKELGVEKCDLPTLFERAFVVSNHLANNPQTVGMLNYDLFKRMREKAVFINTGRGAQVVEEDLVRILMERPDLTALLDVTMPEPPVENHPFYTLENCFLTPHIAGSIGDEVARMGEYMLEEYNSYISGQPCKYEVTKEMLETMA